MKKQILFILIVLLLIVIASCTNEEISVESDYFKEDISIEEDISTEQWVNEDQEQILKAFGQTIVLEELESIENTKGHKYLVSENIEFTLNDEGQIISYFNRDEEKEAFGGLATFEEVSNSLKQLFGIDDSYIRTIVNGVSDGFIWLGWEKVVMEGVTNRYDSVKIHMNLDTLQIEGFSRFLEELEVQAVKLAKEQAIKLVNTDEENEIHYIDAYLDCVKPLAEYVDDENIRLAYIVYDDSRRNMIWIDAITGEVLGRDELQSE